MNAYVPKKVIINPKRRVWTIYICAFILPVFIFFLLCAYMKRYPFGSLTILDMDLPGQYIHFFSYLKSILSGKNNFYYTFSKTLGGDMVGLSAYYLLSPLNFIFIFFNEASLPMACTILVALKLGLCGLCMAIFLTHITTDTATTESPWVLLFSSAYALMSYNMVYMSNIMWIDAVYVLPVMALGIEFLIKNRSGLLYTLSLAYALISNYYTGYMLCLFSLFYFAFRFINLILVRAPEYRRVFLHYILFSFLSGCIAAFVLIPTFLSLSGTKATIDTGRLAIFRIFPLSAFILRLFSNSVLSDMSLQNLPYIYTGILTNALLALYFFNSGIRFPERVAALVFLLILLLSFNFNNLYVIWHAFNYPACFPYRNAFVLSFMMLYLSWQCLIHRDGLSLWSFVAATALVAVAVLLSSPFSNPDFSNTILIVDIAVTLLVFVVLVIEKHPTGKRMCFAALAIVQLLFLFENAVYLKNHATDGHTLDAAEYTVQVNGELSEIDYISKMDNSFYRIATSSENANEPMQLNYNSLSHFSSTDKSAVKEFVKGFGYQFFRDSWVAYGHGSTASNDALFSVKYVDASLASQKGYNALYDNDGNRLSVLKNPNSLGIAFVADRSVLDASLDNRDVFLRQNQAFSAILGRSVEILTPVDELCFDAVNFRDTREFEDATIYFCDSDSSSSEFTYSFTAVSDDPVYLYSYAPFPEYVDLNLVAQLYVNGEPCGEYMGPYSWETVCIGRFEPGEKVKVTIVPEHDYFILGNSFIYHENMALLTEYSQEIIGRAQGAELEKISSSSLKWQGSVPQESQLLLLTVPKERGWSLYIDGQAAKISCAFETLMAVELSPGEHCLELKYVPPGLYAGITITLSALAILCIYILITRKKHM